MFSLRLSVYAHRGSSILHSIVLQKFCLIMWDVKWWWSINNRRSRLVKVSTHESVPYRRNNLCWRFWNPTCPMHNQVGQLYRLLSLLHHCLMLAPIISWNLNRLISAIMSLCLGSLRVLNTESLVSCAFEFAVGRKIELADCRRLGKYLQGQVKSWPLYLLS